MRDYEGAEATTAEGALYAEARAHIDAAMRALHGLGLPEAEDSLTRAYGTIRERELLLEGWL